MTYRFIATVWSLVVFSSASYGVEQGAPVTASSLQQAKTQLVERLRVRKFFRAGSCADVLDSTLSFLKMPSVGTRKKTAGVDRSGEHEPLPRLKDVVTTEHEGQVSLETFAKSDAVWQIKITRAPDSKNKLVTFETYQVKPQSNSSPLCELQDVSFEMTSAAAKREIASTPDCLDLFVLDQSGAREKKALEWMQKDCFVALHYSKTAMNFGAKK